MAAIMASSTATSQSAKRKRASSPPAREDSSGVDFPARDCERLFAQDATVDCATNNLCVPCAYKIGCFDVALDHEFTKTVPNQRPEQCPRANKASTTSPREGTLGYRSGMSVLTIGDGDLSFSLAIARLLSREDNRCGGERLVATSYETRETLERVYPNFLETLSELKALGARVVYEVDATRLDVEPWKASGDKGTELFHRIAWNFPCTAILQGQDGQNSAMEENKDLVRRFVRDARHLLHPFGEIHMSHKTKPPYNQWKLEEVALEMCKGDPVVEYRGRVVLDRYILLPYTPRKALDRKSFPCHDACTFIFGTETKQVDLTESGDLYPSSIARETAVDDAGNDQVAVLIVPVTREVIGRIREKHLRKTSRQYSTSNKKRRNNHAFKRT